ncbi:hypothetical protein F5Y00DRAFT_268543 [Daldinia vernicosa]|uniref:uncharacterized protein n=1 Tax=Daldinia vernicosa TaxID=114800 RepID=UPI002008B662|nr:uncharacterized protein F5Y00DRAFT_268543 [Daldinia vernicosa]KAI0850431.1 hypothetical protein F5Y00DRAFT_268543 [Daldinia vernicosa]
MDESYHQGFAETIASIRKNYNQVLGDSRLLAADIAQNGKSFDTILVQYCADGSFSLEERKTRIASFILGTKRFEETSKDIQQRFSNVKTDVTSFAETFSSWADGKEGEVTSQIKELEKEISDLTEQLNQIKAAQTAMAAVAGAARPVATTLGTIFQPIQQLILIGGLITVVVSLAASLSLIVAAERVQHEINKKTSDKEDLEKQLEGIRKTRQELQSAQSNGLLSFTACIDVLPEYWNSTIRDAQSIHDWLENGADTTARPTYMNLNIDRRVKSYNSAAAYLEKYAHGG